MTKCALLNDLKSCSLRRDLVWGRRIHARAVNTGHGSNVCVLTALVKMYGRCGSLLDARRAFDSIQQPNVASWNALLLGHAENGKCLSALELFAKMKSDGYAPDSATYVSALKACTSLAVNRDGDGKRECLERGRQIHFEAACHLDQYVQNTLIEMYAKGGSMVDARCVFESINKPNVVSWTAVILGYAENGEGCVALELFSRMKAAGCAPNSVTYVAALKACASLAAVKRECKRCFERGKQIHLEIGCHSNHYVQNTLIDMYGKCGRMADAHLVFHKMQKPDVVSWTALIQGYAENGAGLAALDLFTRMKVLGVRPHSLTYVAALKACTSLTVNGDTSSCLERGREIHLEIGDHPSHYVQSALIEMYANGGSLAESSRVFASVQNPDVVAWNVLILGYAENGEGFAALSLFSRMKAGGFVPNSATYIAAIKACTSLAANGAKKECLERGTGIRLEIGSHLNHRVQSILIEMYAKCGDMVEARTVFDSIQEPDVVSWSTLLRGYAENGESLVVLDLFSRMKACGCAPNTVSYVAALKACGSIKALSLGRTLHLELQEFPSYVVTGLVDLYAKCGSMVEAQAVFDRHPAARDISTWNVLLAGYASLNSGSVFTLFEAMQGTTELRPNAVTFVSVILCCSHAGLVQKARDYFEAMQLQYRVTPAMVHYNCMLDVLGRGNQLNEAIQLLRVMPCSPDAVTWRALLGACRKWKNVELGQLAFRSLVAMDRKDTSAYVLMAHIYGSRGMWEEQEKVFETRFA